MLLNLSTPARLSPGHFSAFPPAPSSQERGTGARPRARCLRGTQKGAVGFPAAHPHCPLLLLRCSLSLSSSPSAAPAQMQRFCPLAILHLRLLSTLFPAASCCTFFRGESFCHFLPILLISLVFAVPPALAISVRPALFAAASRAPPAP